MCCGRYPDKGITRLMVEGGAQVAASFVEAGLVDEVSLLRGPTEIGANGVVALGALPLGAITQSNPPSVFVLTKASITIPTIYERA